MCITLKTEVLLKFPSFVEYIHVDMDFVCLNGEKTLYLEKQNYVYITRTRLEIYIIMQLRFEQHNIDKSLKVACKCSKAFSNTDKNFYHSSDCFTCLFIVVEFLADFVMVIKVFRNLQQGKAC